MATNAPVHAKIITPQEARDLIMDEHFTWTHGAREYVLPPTVDEILESFKTAFTSLPLTVTFLLAVKAPNFKMIDFIEGRVTGISYESGAPGMFMIELKSEDPRWTKVRGYYNCYPGSDTTHGWLNMTLRR